MGPDTAAAREYPLRVSATRVTVIDDDGDVGDLFRDIFTAIGDFDVAVHVNAMPGIDELMLTRPALIVIDLDLDPEREELSGTQIIHSIRSGVELRDVPIIVTALDSPRLAEAWPAFMDRGDVHRLYKPFDLATFERVVETALGDAHPADGTGPAPQQLHERIEQGG